MDDNQHVYEFEPTGNTTKKCYRCQLFKRLDNFTKNKSRRDGLSAWCKDCTSLATKISDSKPTVKLRKKKYAEKYNLAVNFGITPDEYSAMLKRQGGVCRLCGKKETSRDRHSGEIRKLAVDHDHNTGKLRGLLCSRCNKNLGIFEKNKDAYNRYIEGFASGRQQ